MVSKTLEVTTPKCFSGEQFLRALFENYTDYTIWGLQPSC